MARIKGSTNDTVFQSYKFTHSSLSPVENLMLAVYEQAVEDLRLLVKNGQFEKKRSSISIADIYDFFDKSYYNKYMEVDGKEIYNHVMNQMVNEGYITQDKLTEIEDKAISQGVKADRIAYDREMRKKINVESIAEIENDIDEMDRSC